MNASYAVFFAAFTFAHRALCAAAIFLRAAAEIAKVAMARRLAIRLYWMWRKGWNYEQSRKFGSHAGKLGTGDGVQ